MSTAALAAPARTTADTFPAALARTAIPALPAAPARTAISALPAPARTAISALSAPARTAAVVLPAPDQTAAVALPATARTAISALAAPARTAAVALTAPAQTAARASPLSAPARASLLSAPAWASPPSVPAPTVSTLPLCILLTSNFPFSTSVIVVVVLTLAIIFMLVYLLSPLRFFLRIHFHKFPLICQPDLSFGPGIISLDVILRGVLIAILFLIRQLPFQQIHEFFVLRSKFLPAFNVSIEHRNCTIHLMFGVRPLIFLLFQITIFCLERHNKFVLFLDILPATLHCLGKLCVDLLISWVKCRFNMMLQLGYPGICCNYRRFEIFGCCFSSNLSLEQVFLRWFWENGRHNWTFRHSSQDNGVETCILFLPPCSSTLRHTR